jgi:hypothetical protein
MNQRAKRVLLAATLPWLSGEALAQDAYLAGWQALEAHQLVSNILTLNIARRQVRG